MCYLHFKIHYLHFEMHAFRKLQKVKNVKVPPASRAQRDCRSTSRGTPPMRAAISENELPAEP